MLVLIAGLVLFLGVHHVPARVALRARLVERFGVRGYRVIFSAASLAGLALIVWGYGLARQTPVIVWDPPLWTRHLAALLLILAFILLAAAYLPGRIKQKTRHPMFAAVKLWAFAHLLTNGALVDIVLFGSLLAWAVAGRISAGRRERAGLLTPPGGGPVRNDIAAIAIGGVAYVLFALWLHEWLIGVAPFG